MKLLNRIRLTLHSAVEVVRDGRERERRRSQLPDTVLLRKPSDSTLRRLRNLHAT